MANDGCDLLCLDLPRAEALRKTAPRIDELERSAERAKALSDPTRLAIASALARGGELCVCDLAWVVEKSEKLVSHHVRVLKAARRVERRRDGKMVMYSLSDEGKVLLEAVKSTGAVAA